ncbi:MAG: lipopolysaccharide heptosyltransferase II [Bacteroidota bacterium]
MEDVLHKTLIIRLSSVGDVVLSSPLVRALRGRFPSCQIDYCVKSAYADLVRHSPHLSHVIEFPDHGGLADLLRLRSRIASAGYDLIIDIHDSIRSRLLCAGSRRVVRVNKRKFARMLLVRFKVDVYDRFGGAPGVAERYLETVRPFGVLNDRKGLDLFIPGEARASVDSLLAEEHLLKGTPCIGICPSAKHGNKMWPAERFAAAAGALASQLGAAILLFGGETDRARCDHIALLIQREFTGPQVINLAGWSSLIETAAALERCRVVLTNDTGLMHIAAARGVKLVAMFGPTVRRFGFFPPEATSRVVEQQNLSCRPCTHIGLPRCPKRHFRCMKDTSVETVVAAAAGLLEGAK